MALRQYSTSHHIDHSFETAFPMEYVNCEHGEIISYKQRSVTGHPFCRHALSWCRSRKGSGERRGRKSSKQCRFSSYPLLFVPHREVVSYILCRYLLEYLTFWRRKSIHRKEVLRTLPRTLSGSSSESFCSETSLATTTMPYILLLRNCCPSFGSSLDTIVLSYIHADGAWRDTAATMNRPLSSLTLGNVTEKVKRHGQEDAIMDYD